MVKKSSLGIFIKQIRLSENDETMTEMARRLGISVSYLSGIENEKRPMTDEIFELLCERYSLTTEQREELSFLKSLAGKKMNINLDQLEPSAQKTTVKFLSNVDSLSDADLARINKIINKKGK
jgi:transcriptional regulator with XRE-family HTH domain